MRGTLDVAIAKKLHHIFATVSETRRNRLREYLVSESPNYFQSVFIFHNSMTDKVSIKFQ